MNNTKIYLCNAEGAMLGSITGIKADTCSLTKNATDFWEISFEVDRYIEVNGALTQSSYYDSIDDMMRLYLDSENTQAFFVIDSEPVIRGSGLQETKSVTAHSIECELNHVYLKDFKVNCGTYDSQEYLAVDNNGNFYNINPYTGLPYEYISLINYNDTQLSLLHLVLQNTGWTVKEGIGTLYLDNDDYFKIILTTVSDPSGSLERAVGCVKKRWSETNGVYAIELQKWDSAAIEFTTKDITDITIAAQGADTISSATEDTFAYSPIALKDANGNIISNEDGITRVYGNTEDEKGITINYRGLKPGTYKITSPYDAALNRGVQIKSIIVTEQNAAEAIKTQHIFKVSDLTSAKDNEEITGLCQMKGSFDTSDSVYSFLMKTVSPTASVIFEFDRKHKTVGVVKAADYGKDTGVFITMRNLMNSFEVTSSSQDSIMTKLTPKGANDLGIEYVNFGKDYILNLDYFMNETNEYGDYKFVSRDLHDKYNIWKNYRETDTVTYNGNTYTRRELYRELTRQYNQSVLEISGLKNRVPNDFCLIDYTTYSLEDLKTSLTAYRKALASLITLYKNEYGVTALGNAPDYSPAPEGAVSIKNTPYWYDFYAYQDCIIPQVEEALKMYCQTDENGNLAVDENGDYIELDTGNTDYYADTSIVKTVDSYLYEWSLYGLDELEAKKKAWSEAANILYNECFILKGTASAPEKYRTADETGWNSLTDEQKSAFTTQNAYISQLNSYLDYLSFDERENSLTGTKCKGIIRQCDDAITGRTNEIAEIKGIQTDISSKRSELARSVLPEEITIDGEKLFSNDDLAVITSLMRETDYTNENILITNLDDIVSEVDAQEELYQAAMEKLYEISQPQYSFSTELDNLFSLEDFKAYQKPFDVGNYIRVGLEIHEELNDNNYIKLRLISMTYNPLEISENLSVEFSTMTKSLNGISDLAFLLDSEISSSRSSSSGSSSGSGTYGSNDANVQISNNMLNALLSTELFGTAVTDVILDSIQANKGDFNTLFSHSGVFDSLEAGLLKVSGDSMFGGTIQSLNYNTLNKTGSMINLTDGTFSFAGGALTYDADNGLVIQGVASKESVTALSNSLNTLSNGLTNGSTTINGGCITTGNIKSSNWNGTDSNPLNNTQGSIMQLTDGKFSFGGGKLKWDGELLSIEGTGRFTGEVQATSGTFTGTVNATSGSFTGDVTANTLTANKKGTIAGWTFDGDAFYRNSNCIATNNAMYLGADGFSINDYFVITKNGLYFKSNEFTQINYNSEISDIIIAPGEYIRVYLYNMGDINYFNLSFQYSCGYIKVYDDGSARTESLDGYTIRGWGADGRTTPVDSVMEYDGQDVKIFYQSYETLFPEPSDAYIDPDDDDAPYECSVRVYSYTRNNLDGDKIFYGVQIGKVEICDSNGAVKRTYEGTVTGTSKGFMINTYTKHIFSDNYYLSDEKFQHKGIYSTTSTASSNLYINSDGQFMRSSSSSENYKTDISSQIPDDISPIKIYDLDVCAYKYKSNYLPPSDQRYGEAVIGFIAEDVYKKYPIACNLDANGNPEMWNINILFPALTKLVQEQHKDIEKLKDEIEKLKQK